MAVSYDGSPSNWSLEAEKASFPSIFYIKTPRVTEEKMLGK